MTKRTPKLTADWDLQLASDGNLAMADDALAVAQNISCACKNFKGGLYFFATSGIAWFSDALAHKLRRSLIASRLRDTALQVEGVASIDQITIDTIDPDTRTVTGSILFTATDGTNGRAYI